MTKIVFVFFLIFSLVFSPVAAYATSPSDFPGAQHGIINSITQNSTTIDVSVRFDNFAAYTATLFNNDCYNDPGAAFQIYNADTGALVSSRTGEARCGSLGNGNTWLSFPPLQLATGNYFIHYRGGNGSEWVTENYSFTAPVPPHAKPTTTSSLSPEPTSPVSGLTIYPDPVTVTLSATADTGYNIATTYYKIDGGAQQTYTSPFTVSGSGSHSIEFWSIDNSGLEELPKKSRGFVISPQHGVINSIIQNGTTIDVSVHFDNFAAYTGTLFNNDCYNDPGASFETYNAVTGARVSSRTGEAKCGSLGNGNSWLSFPPLQLPTGTYFIHYHGGNGSEWITENYSYTEPVPVHNRPTSTSSLAPVLTTPGVGLTIYPDPVTVTLSATADTGYSVSNIYYKLDGGAQQLYTAPFTVSGSGTHSYEYWSVDNTGLEELPHKSRSFIINPQGGKISYITQNGSNIDVGVRFDNFSAYTGKLFNNDCYNDGGKSFQLYNATTGALVTSQSGEQKCYSIFSIDTFLIFPPIQLAPGTYFIHYHGGDGSEWITDNFNFPAPTTTASLATQNADNTYSDPTTVTLSASAVSGYAIANTYYTIDGGEQQTYTAPFTVSGNGSHTIAYWSVYTNGTEEFHKTTNFTINHTNQAPHVDPFSGASLNVGGTFIANSSFTDSDSSSWTATVDYGDGAGAVNLSLNADKTFSLNHQYTSAGTYTVTVVVTDNQGATGATMATVIVNAAPQISGLSDTEINYQDDFIQSGSFTDADSTSWTATVDYGDGFEVQPLALNPDKTFTLNRLYPAAGTYTAIVTVTDNQGATGKASITVKVNAPAHINQLLGATINEGQTYTENGSFSDTDSTSWTGVVNYGDGSDAEALVINPDNSFFLNHLYKDNGSYTVVVTITDNQGSIGTRTATVTVNNVSPNVQPIIASIDPVQVNTPTVASTTFTDDGVLDTHTAVWNWGDGTTTNATINSGSISDSHTYTTAGVYTIMLTVTDNNGGSTPKTYQYLSVYNPTVQGLFSAGQRFTSPSGGNVTFGLSYKYQGTVPTGTRQFSMDYNQANIHFNATSVSSLVINNGMGTLTGTGTFNGQSGYDFLVTGSENANTIRIQIKNHQTGAVVYDTQPGDPANANPTTVVTGNILAH